MESIWNASELLIFLIFVIPGFVMLKYWEAHFPGPVRDKSKQIIDAIAYSSINYAFLAGPILIFEINGWLEKQPWMYIAFAPFVLFVVPLLICHFFIQVRQSGNICLKKFIPHPVGRAWDYFFGLGEPFWVVATLVDGRVVGGLYSNSSFASSSPHSEEIFLEESWVTTPAGGLSRPKKDTAGILIATSKIVTIEFFELYERDGSDG